MKTQSLQHNFLIARIAEKVIMYKYVVKHLWLYLEMLVYYQLSRQIYFDEVDLFMIVILTSINMSLTMAVLKLYLFPCCWCTSPNHSTGKYTVMSVVRHPRWMLLRLNQYEFYKYFLTTVCIFKSWSVQGKQIFYLRQLVYRTEQWKPKVYVVIMYFHWCGSSDNAKSEKTKYWSPCI